MVSSPHNTHTRQQSAYVRAITIKRINYEIQQHSHPMDNYWNTLNQFHAQMSQYYLVNQQQENKSRELKYYRKRQYNCEESYRIPEEKKLHQGWWKYQGLPLYQRMVGANNSWVEDKLNLLK
jgi:hypothetical protein